LSRVIFSFGQRLTAARYVSSARVVTDNASLRGPGPALLLDSIRESGGAIFFRHTAPPIEKTHRRWAVHARL
jgi:hypothetical protein